MGPPGDDLTWGQLALETAHRAALYSHVAMEAGEYVPQIEVADGLCSFETLSQLRAKDEPQANEWWWVYAPLLTKLLGTDDGVGPRAGLVGLGNHIGTGDDQPRRHWLNFVPASFEVSRIKTPSANESQVLALIGFNADRVTQSTFSSRVKLTTRIVDEYGKPQTGQRLLRPLVVDFTPSGVLDPEPGWASVKSIRELCADVDTKLLHVGFANAAGGNGLISYAEGFWDALADKHQPYLDSLAARYPSNEWRDDEKGLCVWLSDILRRLIGNGGGDVSTSAPLVITVPAWLPANDKGDISGSITVYSTGNSWLTRQNVRNELADFISTYHSASMSFLAPFERGRQRQVERAAHIFDLVRPPLDELTEALKNLQRSAQEIRGILYDPSTALFQSYRQIAPFFEDGTIEYGDCLLKIEHEPKSYKPDKYDSQPANTFARDWRLMAQMVAAALLCRIFGRDEELKGAKSANGLIDRAKGIVQDILRETRFDELVTGLVAIKSGFASTSHADLLHILDAPTGAIEFLEEIKAAVFTPFKVDAQSWPVSALKLVLMGMGPPSGRRQTNPTFRVDGRVGASLVKRPNATPLAYNTLLDFLHKVMLVFRRQNANSWLDAVEVNVEGQFIQIDLKTMPSRTAYCKSASEAEKLRRDVIAVLKAPREWRIEGANEGDFRAPYVHLAARLLNVDRNEVDDTDRWKIDEKMLPESTAGLKGLYEVLAVKRGARRFSISIGVKDGGLAIRVRMNAE